MDKSITINTKSQSDKVHCPQATYRANILTLKWYFSFKQTGRKITLFEIYRRQKTSSGEIS